MSEGIRMRYRGQVDDAQVQWGGNDDPRGVLVEGEIYEIERVDEHTWHTKYWIKGRKYNSIHFEPVGENPAPPRAPVAAGEALSEGMTARERAAAERFGHDPALWGIRERADFLAGWDAALAKAEAIAKESCRACETYDSGGSQLGTTYCHDRVADAIAALRKEEA